jgi:hypothetical protein
LKWQKHCYDYSYDVEGTLQDAIDSYLDEEMKEMGWDDGIVKVYPCSHHVEPLPASTALII